MAQVTNRSDSQPSENSRSNAGQGAVLSAPFAGLLDAVIVEGPVSFTFAGCVARSAAEAGWVWVHRDLCADLIPPAAMSSGSFSAAELEAVLPQVLIRMKESLVRADKDPEEARRLRAMLGSDESRAALPALLNALRGRALLGKAQAFGRAINTMTDDGALTVALQSMPLQDPPLASLLFHAALGQIANPTRLVTAIIKLSGNATEAAVVRSGFTPLIEAMLAHAQNQIYLLRPTAGAFSDIDLVCRALDRFHKLVRALTGYIEFARGSRWANILSTITKQVSDRIEPRLRDVVPDINLALRRGRETSVDMLDNDRLLGAINGVYLLSTVRACRDSLAINAIFDQVWSQSGETLEHYLQRNLDLHRENPSDPVVSARLDAGIKMAEIRFNLEYADTLRRSRAASERRA